jgi:signal transduction histidine kinase
LDLTKIDNQTLELHKQRFNLNQVVLLVIQDIQKRKQVLDFRINNGYEYNGDTKITLLPSLVENRYDTSADIFVEADAGWIVQVLTNLLDNALKFTREDNTILISIQAQVNERKKTREVVVSIRDNGTGIDPEVMPRLFTKFATKSSSIRGTKGKGIGLGLYISKNVIEAHEGRIWAENNVDKKGTTFSFSLPLSE